MDRQGADALQGLNNAISNIQSSVSRLLEAVSVIQDIQHELITGMSRIELTQSNYPTVLKTKDVAKILGVSQVKVYDIINKPGFPVIRDGRLILVPRDAFFRWLQRSDK